VHKVSSVSCHLTNRLRTNHRQRHLLPTVAIRECIGRRQRPYKAVHRPLCLCRTVYCILYTAWLVCNHHLSHFAPVLNQCLLKPATLPLRIRPGACIKFGFIKQEINLVYAGRRLQKLRRRRRDEEMFTATIALLI